MGPKKLTFSPPYNVKKRPFLSAAGNQELQLIREVVGQ
jgi:hypothetical protein